MPEYTCDKCNQEFKQKIDYTRHINKKYPCITQEELKDKIMEDDSLKQLDSFFSRMRDVLRDNENITGDKALDVITDFLFLRLLNYELDKNKNMNFITKKYNDKITVDKEDYDIDEYKKYFKWSELMNLIAKIDKDSKDQESKHLLTNIVQHVIFSGIFKLNENTNSIYRNRRFYVKKLVTIIKLLKEYNKIDFDKFDVDVKGRAYELTLQKEGATNKDFSQFFTPRWIDKYMVSHAEIKINDDGSYTKIMDPACGTAGILSEYLSTVKKKAEKEDIIIDNDISKYIYGTEVVDDTLKIAHMNILLKSGTYDTNLKCKDFLENGCVDYINEKFNGHIIMNPPFALTKNYDLTTAEMKKIFHTQTKSGTMLFLMASLNTIKNGRQLILVSPNGKEIFNKNKEFVNIRKNVVENANLYKIAILPDGSFKPYTGVQTLVLMMKKGEKTKEIQFVKVNKNKDDSFTETKICKVKHEELAKKNYSWNYKEYVQTENKYTTIEYKKLIELCDFLPTTKHTSSIGNNTGKYRFYNSSQTDKLYLDDYEVDKKSIIIGNGGNICVHFDKFFTPSKHVTVCQHKDEFVKIKYLYYYLFVNVDKLKNLTAGNTIAWLNKTNLGNLQIPVPPIEVQNLIVKELDSMYKQKESLQNAINEMNNYRKVQFEMLLSKCKNVKNLKLENLCEFNKNSNSENEFDAYHYIDISSVSEGKLIEIKNINKNELPSRAKRYGKKNDILLSSVRPNLKNFLFLTENELHENTVISTGFIMITPNTKLINPKYLYYNISDDTTTEILVKKTTGANYPSINTDDIKDIIFTLPSLKDQELIVQQMEKYDELVKLQQAQIEEIDTTIKTRFEFHLEKCKETKSTEKPETEEILEDEVSNDSTTKKITVKSKQITKSKSKVDEETNENEDLEAELEQETLKTKRPSAKIKVDEVSNKSSKSEKSTSSINPVKSNNIIKKSTTKIKEIEELEEKEQIIETVIVGKVECINEGSNYYKFINGKKGELYAKTSNGKVILYKKPTIKKVETMEDELDEMEKELNNIPKTKSK